MRILPALVLLAAIVACSGSDQGSCQRYGGGSCCPLLNPLNIEISEAVENQPTYVVFYPRNEDSCALDNACITFFPVPDDSETFISYLSRVYNNGINEISTAIVSQPLTSVRRLGRALCMVTDTAFAEVECETSNIILNQRCFTHGDCTTDELLDSPSRVYGTSEARQPICTSCLNRAKAAISNNGLPEDDFHILPMRLPSRCVLNQVCTVASMLQRFCQTVGVAFPAVNRCANLYSH